MRGVAHTFNVLKYDHFLTYQTKSLFQWDLLLQENILLVAALENTQNKYRFRCSGYCEAIC